MSSRIMIGCWSPDRGIAEAVQEQLESLGLLCAVVSEETLPIAGLREALEEWIDGSDVLLLVCTPQSVPQPWVHRFAAAWRNQQRVACLVCVGLGREDLPAPLDRYSAYQPDELPQFATDLGETAGAVDGGPEDHHAGNGGGGAYREGNGGGGGGGYTAMVPPDSEPAPSVAAEPPPAAAEPPLTRGIAREPMEEEAPPSGEDRESGPHRALRDTGKTQVEFKSYCPKEVRPSVWYTLLAYAHAPEAAPEVAADKTARLEGADDAVREARADTTLWLERGTSVTVVPTLTGCTFNPSSATFQWVEDWHRVEFRFRASPDAEGFELDAPVRGSLAFCVGPVIVGELRLSTYITEEADADPGAAPRAEEAGKPYRAIFCSYSHRDTAIIEKLEAVYEALGDTMIRDKRKLRSGEEWEPALAEMIEAADVFQLYWSAAAKASRNVEKEWRHALDLARRNFIRPLTWERPEPELPVDLSHLHFATIKLEL